MHIRPIRASGSQITYNIVTKNVWDYNIKTNSEEKNFFTIYISIYRYINL